MGFKTAETRRDLEVFIQGYNITRTMPQGKYKITDEDEEHVWIDWNGVAVKLSKSEVTVRGQQ